MHSQLGWKKRKTKRKKKRQKVGDIIEKIYETKHPHFARLIHIDAYRLNGGRELQVLNFEKIVENKNNLIIIEWPENVIDILPENHIKIHCDFVNENSRKFEVQ